MYTVSVIGSYGCGKTAFLEANGVQDGVVTVQNTQFEVKESTIQSYPDGASSGIIVLFDCTSIESFMESMETIEQCREANPNTPIIWTAAKVEVKKRVILYRAIQKAMKMRLANKNITYCEVSVKSNYCISKPFEHIIRNL